MAFDVFTPQQLFQIMKNYMVANQDDSRPWNFNVGSRIRTLLESVALLEAMTAHDYYLKLKDAVFYSVMDSFGFSKKEGTKASGYLTFYNSTGESFEIDPATRVSSFNGLLFETVNEETLEGTSSLTVAAKAVEAGSSYNISSEDIDTESSQGSLMTAISGVENVKAETAFSGGSEEESDEEQLERFNQQILGLTTSTHDGLVAAALSVSGIKSAVLLESYPQRGVNTLLCDDGSGSGELEESLKTEVENLINGDATQNGYRAAGIEVDISAPSKSELALTINLYRGPYKTITDEKLKSLVKNSVVRYINSRKIGEDVVASACVAEARKSHSDIFDVKVSFDSLDSDSLDSSDTIVSADEISIIRISDEDNLTVNIAVSDEV